MVEKGSVQLGAMKKNYAKANIKKEGAMESEEGYAGE